MSSELEKLEIFEEAPVLAELSSQLRLLVKTRDGDILCNLLTAFFLFGKVSFVRHNI